jgi:tetratricopeptide (TPR) repeat protein
MKKIFFILAIIVSQFAIGQQREIDSLKNLLKTDKKDTTKLIHLYGISDLSETIGNYPDGIKYGNKAIAFADVLIKDNKNKIIQSTAKKYKAKALINIGIVYRNQGNYPEALKNYFASMKIREAIGDKNGIAGSYSNIGSVYYDQGNYPEALKNHFASLKIYEAIGHKYGIALSYGNIGNVYYNQGNYPEALKKYIASLKIQEAIGDKYGIASSYNNIGSVYERQGNYPEALKNYSASLKIREAIGDKRGIAMSYNNIGGIYYDQGNYLEAFKYYFACLKIQEAIGDKYGIANSYNNIGLVNLKLKKIAEAKKYLEDGLNLSKEIGAKDIIRDSYSGLAQVDSITGNYKSQVANYKLYILYRDSLDNEETRKKTIQSQMTYDFEKKEAVAEAEHKSELKNQKRIADEKNRKQKLITYFVVGGLGLVLVFAVFVFRSLRITRKQKVLIEKQKLAVEQHQKEIIDSIKYAKRIQVALLPSNKNIDRNIKRLKKSV